MLTNIILLTSFSFAFLYPLCFWLSADDPLKNKFHKFHLGLPNVVGGVVVVFALFMPLPLYLKTMILAWKLFFLFCSRLEWKKETPRPIIITLPSVVGLFVFIQLHNALIGVNILSVASWILGGLIFVSVLYAMNLGHWYLNVHGLPIVHLYRATLTFGILLMIRLIWDLFLMLTQPVIYRGDTISIFKFIATLDGFLLLIALFFGTLFPLISVYFALETAKLKNTQSTTGILYAILCSVALGDFAYKYYLLHYGLPL